MRNPAHLPCSRIILGICIIGVTLTWSCGQTAFTGTQGTLFVDREPQKPIDENPTVNDPGPPRPEVADAGVKFCEDNPDNEKCKIPEVIQDGPTPDTRSGPNKNGDDDDTDPTATGGETTGGETTGGETTGGETTGGETTGGETTGGETTGGEATGDGMGGDGDGDGMGGDGDGDGMGGDGDGDGMGGDGDGDGMGGDGDGMGGDGDGMGGDGDGDGMGGDGDGDGIGGDGDGGAPTDPPQTTDTIPLNQGDGPLDLVFIVDNSTSMLDEIGRVQQRISEFVADIKDRSDIRLMIVSLSDNDSPRDYATLQIADSILAEVDLVWVNARVDSQQSLLIAALASCPAASNALEVVGVSHNYTVCNQPVSSIWGLNPRFDLLNGSLAPHFREGAKQIFVSITDDDIITSDAASEASPLPANLIDHTNIRETLNNANPTLDPYFFAFASLEDTPECDNYTPAIALQQLTIDSGGSFYDICADDWQPYFEDLANKAVIITIEDVQLEQATANQVLQVKQGDRIIPASAYALGANGVLSIIDSNALDPNGALELEVTYQY